MQSREDKNRRNNAWRKAHPLTDKQRSARAIYDKQRSKTHKKKPLSTEQNRAKTLRQAYGITIEQFEELLLVAGNKCQICGRPFAKGACGKQGPHIDHDHTTGKIRGILCNNCNIGIGLLRDSATVLVAATIYLNERNNV